MTGHLIHIGYAKTGSNFLRRWFADHPQLQFTSAGIAGYANVYEISRQAAAGRPGVLYRVTSCEGLATPHPSAGDPVVDYDGMMHEDLDAARAEVCSMLVTLFPAAHILLLTRGFRSMILSSFSQYARSGGHIVLSDLIHGAHGDRSDWHYDNLIDLYRSAFGDRLIVMPYELLRDDPERFVAEIELRLGLSHCPAPAVRPNKSLSPEEMNWYPRISQVIRRLPVGDRLRKRLLRAYVGRTMSGSLLSLARLLDHLSPAGPVVQIPDQLVETFRGKANRLRGNSLYAPYADDYLL